MSQIKLNLIVATCENMGIGKNNDLPWKLKKEMAYFTKMTKTTSDPNKRNLVIMGRRTWDSVPEKFKPFSDRINLVLSRQPDMLETKVPNGVLVCGSLNEAIDKIKNLDKIEKVWVIGGSSIYKEAMNHPNCYKIYLTEIQKLFDCDTFFPTISNDFKLLNDHSNEFVSIPTEKQVENDIEYYFRIYENKKCIL